MSACVCGDGVGQGCVGKSKVRGYDKDVGGTSQSVGGLYSVAFGLVRGFGANEGEECDNGALRQDITCL